MIANLIWLLLSGTPVFAQAECVRECGAVRAFTDLEGAKRIVLEVETGFDWGRGEVSKTLFEIQGRDPRVMGLLRPGTSLCVTGDLIVRADKIPAIIPRQIEVFETYGSMNHD